MEILKGEVFDVLVMVLTGREIKVGIFFGKKAAWLLFHWWVKRRIEGRFCEGLQGPLVRCFVLVAEVMFGFSWVIGIRRRRGSHGGRKT